jgi:outer membrane protein assembly factor BamB
MSELSVERQGCALTRRGFLGFLAGGAVVGAAGGYAISQRTASSNSAATDLGKVTIYSSGYGEVYALEANTGKVRWSRPLITSGWLAVGGGGVYAASYDGQLSALDAATGAVRWIRQVSGREELALPYPSVGGHIVYIAPGTGYTYAFSATTGDLLWRRQTSSSGYNQPPVIFNGRLYVGNPDSYVYALDATTGRFLWRSGKGGQGAAGTGLLTVAQEKLFAVGATRLYAFDPSTGKIQNTYPPTLPCANGVAYISSTDGSLRARDLSQSKTLWTRKARNVQWLPGTTDNGTLYLELYNNASQDYVSTNWVGSVMALDAVTGKRIWSYVIPEESFYAPVVTGGAIFVTGEYNLYALDAVNGDARWIHTNTSGFGLGNVVAGAS